jgi:hypothetical protein
MSDETFARRAREEDSQPIAAGASPMVEPEAQPQEVECIACVANNAQVAIDLEHTCELGRPDLPRATAVDSCWHCGVLLAHVSKPRCEPCPDECDIEGCDAFGCEAAPRATGETTVEAALVERKQMRGVLDMLRRGPKTTACWCTGGFHSPPQHSVACKAAHRLYEHLSDMAQIRAAAQTKAESGER